jgi:DNA repair photolyase
VGRTRYEEVEAKRILNVHKHVDGWFYDKYSAHPYMGCAHGCEFCYAREEKYLGGRAPEAFDRVIRVKTNGPKLLRRELQGKPVDILACGDWQYPAERDYRLSRQMLEVVLEAGFPLLVIERSPFVTRDLDLLAAIDGRSWAGVIISISTVDSVVRRAFEPRSPSATLRLRAMERIARAGILVGTALMPVLPAVADDDAHLEAVVRATADHGGRFVLVGALTMAAPQADRVWRVVDEHFPTARPRYEQLYAGDAYGPPRAYRADLGRRVRALCETYGLTDRMPRWIEPGPLGVNRWLAERLHHRVHTLELAEASDQRIWAYRRAAWTVDELATSIEKLHATQGIEGLMTLPGVGQRIGGLLAQWLEIWRQEKP